MLGRITDRARTIAIVCNQWGDTGKGKFSDFFAANWADVIARGTGGNNAGHTVVIDGIRRIFHLIPAGIAYDKKTNILGNGMVIDLEVLCSELDDLDKAKIPYYNLMISEDANVIMPYHIERDRSKNTCMANGGIGSTGRGIGPAYSDKVARIGILMRDLYEPRAVADKLEKIKEYYPSQQIDTDMIMAGLRPFADRVRPYVKDTIREVQRFRQSGKRILLEGAQGLLLSIEYGTYPYVTSSDCSLNGTASGVGLSAKDVDICLGIVKFPFMTRVGSGPFPTELGGRVSEEYCAKGVEHDIRHELEKFDVPFTEAGGRIKYDHCHANILGLMNSADEFDQGVGIRLAAEEYGATTGRPRRTGWTDLVALKYAVGINGPDIILTKTDAVQGMDRFRLGIGYDNHSGFTRDSGKLYACGPVYREFAGFDGDIAQVSDYCSLPGNLLSAIGFLEGYTGANVRIVSVGPDQNETLIKP